MVYRNYFLSKNKIMFLYFKNIFYHVTLENIFKILNNSVYFQNIAVCNEPLRPATLFKKETLVQVFSWEFYVISKNTFITEHLWMATSEKS